MEGDLTCTMVIFGGTGDLTHKKLMPALYLLSRRGILPEGFRVIAVGRRDKTDDDYCEEIKESIRQYTKAAVNDEGWDTFAGRVQYHRQNFEDDSGYAALKGKLSGCNILYYLAVSPAHFVTVIEKLNGHGLIGQGSRWRRLVIEKPFGRDLKSAEDLNRRIGSVIGENDVYRIDHYLGKSMLQNLLVIRFANAVFEPVWNKDYIDNIQISACEAAGVGSRGGYYERFGALRDMVQNHLLQLLTLTAMEPPKNFEEDAVRDEKLKVLLRLIACADGFKTVRGQYGGAEGLRGYREEEKVDGASQTETYAAMKLSIDNERWRGVPFYIRTGKRMPRRSAKVVIEFKRCGKGADVCHGAAHRPNRLVIKIQPEEGVSFEFNAKSPGEAGEIKPVRMDYCQNCLEGINSPEAYERLLMSAMRGDRSLFPDWEEIRLSWVFADHIQDTWQKETPQFPNYAAGTWGPDAAVELLEADGRHWWNEEA